MNSKEVIILIFLFSVLSCYADALDCTGAYPFSCGCFSGGNTLGYVHKCSRNNDCSLPFRLNEVECCLDGDCKYGEYCKIGSDENTCECIEKTYYLDASCFLVVLF